MRPLACSPLSPYTENLSPLLKGEGKNSYFSFRKIKKNCQDMVRILRRALKTDPPFSFFKQKTLIKWGLFEEKQWPPWKSAGEVKNSAHNFHRAFPSQSS